MKRRMGDRKKDGGNAKKSKKTESNWPLIKPKSNLRVTRLKDYDLFTVCYLCISSPTNFCVYSQFNFIFFSHLYWFDLISVRCN